MEYRGDNTGAEERAVARRYSAHCAGVMAPACSIDVFMMSQIHQCEFLSLKC